MIWRLGTEKDEDRAMPHRDAEAVLSEWYTVQHDLDAALFGTPEARRLHAKADRLQDEYQALVDEARQLGLPAVPPFPVPVEA
jgi:hypothetical protein